VINGTPCAPLNRQFLACATTMLACTWRAMGGEIPGCRIPFSLEGELRGLVDYSQEMRLICAEGEHAREVFGL
jgi:hypothetical protein